MVKRLFHRFFKKNKPSPYKLQFLFNHKGQAYYKFPKETNMPLERFANVLKLMEMLSCGLSGSEMNSILENMERAISAGLSNPKNAGIVSTYVNVIRERQDMVVHRDLLLNIAATFILRDDEKPEIINPDIHKEKLEAFEQMSKEAPHDFFLLAAIEPLMPLLTMSPQEFKELWEYNTVQIQALKKALTLLDTRLDSGQAKRKKD